MIYADKPKLLFIHNQKVAGMSIEQFMLNSLNGQKLLERHSYAEDGIKLIGIERWEEYYSFGFVRNPWERLVSWYVMINETPPMGPNLLWDYVHNNSKSFEEFIVNCTEQSSERDGYIYRKSFIRPQFDYFTDKDGILRTTFIGRFENLQDDFDKVMTSVGLQKHKLPVVNKTRDKDYKSFYNKNTREIVAERFKKDINYFGYKF